MQHSYEEWASSGFVEEEGRYVMDAPVEWTLLTPEMKPGDRSTVSIQDEMKPVVRSTVPLADADAEVLGSEETLPEYPASEETVPDELALKDCKPEGTAPEAIVPE